MLRVCCKKSKKVNIDVSLETVSGETCTEILYAVVKCCLLELEESWIELVWSVVTDERQALKEKYRLRSQR
jgi:hypothetical protein